jgi:hypothetical protein
MLHADELFEHRLIVSEFPRLNCDQFAKDAFLGSAVLLLPEK